MPPSPGRFWLDGRTGYMGVEGIRYPFGNLVASLQQAQGGGGSRGFVRGDMIGVTNGNCTMVTVPGYTAASSGC